MSFFGYAIVNGSLRYGGSLSAVSHLITGSSAGIDGTPTALRLRAPDGGAYLIEFNANVMVNAATLSMGASGIPDVYVNREAANTLKFFDGSTTGSTVLLGAVDFRQAASTFAATATMTNGPRAANPIAWVECRVGGSSGRIPVW